MLLGTAVRPVPARMPYISRLCDVGPRTLNADDDDDDDIVLQINVIN